MRQPKQYKQPQKSEFQDMGGEESDKVKKYIYISEALAGNMITVVIRARTKVIKGGEEIKERGSEKRWREEQKEEKSTRERE